MYLLVTVLHGFLQLPFSHCVLLQVDLLQVFDGGSVEVVQLRSQRR